MAWSKQRHDRRCRKKNVRLVYMKTKQHTEKKERESTFLQ